MDNIKLKILFLLQQASEQRTLEDLTEFYMVNLPYLQDYTIINSTETDNSIDLYSVFSDIANVKGQVYTPFYGGKINIVNESIVRRGVLTGDGKAGVQGYISFDTQVISYFYRYYRKQINSLPQNINDILHLLHTKPLGVEYLPYTIENLIFSNKNVLEVRNTIYAFERLYYKNRVPRLYCLQRANRIIRSYNKWRKNEDSILVKTYYLIYATLLKMCYIQLKHRNRSLKQKMIELCDFMNVELCVMMQSELILAKYYFEQGQKCLFFGKIQRNNEKVLDNIRNMAWDLFHLRMLEEGCTIRMNNKADVNIPYFCTYDQRLLNVKSCYELKSMAINYRTGEKIPFYSKTEEIVEYLQKYGTGKQLISRVEQRKEVDIKDLILQLENAIQNIQ